MNDPQASREIMWNISSPAMMYVLFFISLAVFSYGFYRHVQLWRQGKTDSERFSHPAKRFWIMITAVLFQKKTSNTFYPGLLHGLIFYSFIGLVLTTLFILLDADFGTSLYTGGVYVFLTLVCELAGLLMLIGIAMALWRRHVVRPETLDRSGMDTACLLLLAVIVITGFLVEGVRIAVTTDPWARLSPIGYLFSGLVRNSSGKGAHVALWWLHTALVMVWIAIIPFTKFFHLVLLPANAFFSKLNPRGELSRIDLEALMESDDLDEADLNFGVGNIADLTWKQRMDLDACLSCGRCESVCPAFSAGQPLSPKTLIQNMLALLKTSEQPEKETEETVPVEKDIVGSAFNTDFIWFCRTCMACVNICPAYIEHVDTLIDIRRNEVNMKGRLPSHAASALKTMESLGNPFGPQKDRMKWTDGLNVPVIPPGEGCDVLYWTGCFTALDPGKRQIAVDLCEFMWKNGIDFGILGADEHCCGDPARVIGDENLFQLTAKQQVAELNLRKFKQLLVSCPHGYTVLKDEYPQFGGNYNVLHYTEFLYQAVREKGIRLKNNGNPHVVAYHDPCYLGRYQNIFDAPRKLIDAIPGMKRIEMDYHGEKSFCCGGGGGHFWMDFKEGRRINVLRVEQALDAGVEILVTACPFCLHMLDDGIKLMDAENRIAVKDILSFLTAHMDP